LPTTRDLSVRRILRAQSRPTGLASLRVN